MFCPKCGQQATNNEQFCIQCGAKLPNESVTTQPPPKKEDKQQQNPSFSSSLIQGIMSENSSSGEAVVSKKFYLGILAATIFLPIIGIIMGIIYLLKGHPEEKKAGKMWLIVGITVGILNGIIISMNN